MRGCVEWSVLGFILGWSVIAWAGDGQQPGVTGEAELVVALVQSGGLPTVLAFLGWRAAHTLATWTPTVRVDLVHAEKLIATLTPRKGRGFTLDDLTE